MEPRKKRTVIGSIYKGKKEEGKPPSADYIKIRGDISLKKGQCIGAESKAFQLAALDRATAEGLVSSENAEKIRERLEKLPDYVRAELVAYLPEAESRRFNEAAREK